MKEPLEDPLTFRRFPAGVTGIARQRDWDAVAVVEVPELRSSPLSEHEFSAFPGGALRPRGADVPAEALERVAAELDALVDRPYQARAIRTDVARWSAGARRFRGEAVDLRVAGPVASLELVVSPDGERSLVVDGDLVAGSVDPTVAEALRDLESRARSRFQSFVARADRVEGDVWELTIDPL